MEFALQATHKCNRGILPSIDFYTLIHKETIVTRLKNYEMDNKLYLNEFTSKTLEMELSFEIAILPKPRTSPFPLSPNIMFPL
jgi:hypothetical protein